MGHWHSIEPTNLTRQDANLGWVFANYTEAPSENSEHHWYHALHFRNQDRSCFGIKVFEGLVHQDKVRRTATRIVQDADYRASLLSDDPELPVQWKRR